jgi:putative tryptophan/tyrosine transport system substrate-binding protein
MRRRELIALLGGLVARPNLARTQPCARFYRIGILSPEHLPLGMLEAFRQGLNEFGYVEGKNIALEVRDAPESSEKLAAFANELVALRVDVIIAINTPAAQAAKKATSAIPIVMTRLADPVKSGLVTSLARPGGNITGVSFMSDELSGKRLSLLKEALPNIKRLAALWYEGNAGATTAVSEMQAPSRELGLQLSLLPIRDPVDLNITFEAAKASQIEALIVVDDLVVTQHGVEILAWATEHRLAVISLYKPFAEIGALMAYGPNATAMYRRAGYYVDRVLKGTNPGDLPVEQPTKFDFVINLKAAKILGVSISDTMLARADEVIE